MPRGQHKRTAEMIAGIQEKRAVTVEKKKDLRSRGLTIGDWQLCRIDFQNVLLQQAGKTPLYYADFPTALKALFKRLIDPTSKATVQSVLNAIASAEQKLERALANFDENRLPTLTLSFDAEGGDDGD